MKTSALLLLVVSVSCLGDTQFIGFRGVYGYVSQPPENSLPAIDHAYALGADGVELDIQMTADGVVVCLHDGDLLRMTGDPASIGEKTYSELLQLRLKRFDWQTNWEGKAVRIPTLEQAMARNDNRGPFFVDLKGSAAFFSPGMRNAIEGSGIDDSLVHFLPLSLNNAKILKRDFPGTTVYLKTYTRPDELPLSWVDEVAEAGLDAVALDTLEALPSEEFIDYIHGRGLKAMAFVWYGAPGREPPEKLEYLVRVGLDYVVCDNPPPKLGEPLVVQWLADGSVGIRWEAARGRSYTIQSSKDLHSWEPLATVIPEQEGFMGWILSINQTHEFTRLVER